MGILLPMILGICFPAALQLFAGRRVYSDKKKWFLTVVVSTGAAGCAGLCAGLVSGPVTGPYVGLLVCAMVAVAMSFVVFPWIRERHIDHVQLLKASCLLSLCVVVYAIVTVGQTLIHGDIATASMLTQAQMKYGSYFPKNWCYVNGDVWVFTVQTFVAPFAMLMENQSLARMLGSAMIVLAAVIALVVHSRKVFEDDSWVIAVPLLTVFIAGQRDMVLYQAAYTSQLLFMVSTVPLFYRVFHRKGKRIERMLFGGLMALVSMGGIRGIAEFVVPICGAFIAMDYLRIRLQPRISAKQVFGKWFRGCLLLGVPSGVGFFCYLLLKRSLFVVNTDQNALILAGSARECLDNLAGYFAKYLECFGFSGSAALFSLDGVMSMVSLLMFLLVVIVVPVLQARKIKDEPEYVQFFFAYTAVHNLVMFVMTSLFSGKHLSHYLLTSTFALMILSARYIYTYWIMQLHFEKYIWTALFLVAMLVGTLTLPAYGNQWSETLSERKALTQQIMDRGLHKGYGDFWTVYPYEVYSDFGIRFGAVEMEDDLLYPHLWLVDSDVFQVEDTRTFLMLDAEFYQKYADIVTKQFRAPVDQFTIGSIQFFVYDYDIAADLY